MLQTNARNVRKLDSFMVLIFVVFAESRKELRILFFRRDRVRIDCRSKSDTGFVKRCGIQDRHRGRREITNARIREFSNKH